MKTRYIIYVLLFLLVGYLIYNKFYSPKAKELKASMASGGKGGKKKNGPIPVILKVVKDTTLNNIIDVTGTIDANEKVSLISQTAGNITGIYFNEGNKVQKGQLLVKVYNQDLVASLKQNAYQVALSKETEYRNRVLLKKEGRIRYFLICPECPEGTGGCDSGANQQNRDQGSFLRCDRVKKCKSGRISFPFYCYCYFGQYRSCKGHFFRSGEILTTG
jgi:multidrug efflux pump subunit AcrA (membrane-fusion protein)